MIWRLLLLLAALWAADAPAAPLVERWTAPLGSGELEVAEGGRLVLFIAPDGAFEAREVSTGAVRWREAPIEGARWKSADLIADVALLRGTNHQGESMELVVRLADRELLWFDASEESLLFFQEGDRAMRNVLDGGIEERLVDPLTGMPVSPSVYYDGRSPHLLEQVGAVTVVSLRRGEDYWIEGWREWSVVAWTLPIGSGPRSASSFEHLEPGLYRIRGDLVALDPRTGEIAWRIPEAVDDCPVTEGRLQLLASGILTRSCEGVSLYDRATGALLWRRESVDVPVIAGEIPDDIGIWGGPLASRAVQWWSPQGEALERVVLPEPLFFAKVASDGVAAQIERDPRPRWLPRSGGEGWVGAQHAAGLKFVGSWLITTVYTGEGSAGPREDRVFERATGEILASFPHAAAWTPAGSEEDPVLLVYDYGGGTIRALGKPR